jgi:hypothetical protein
MYGDQGADTFIFAAGDGQDSIGGFETGVDMLLLSDALQGTESWSSSRTGLTLSYGDGASVLLHGLTDADLAMVQLSFADTDQLL